MANRHLELSTEAARDGTYELYTAHKPHGRLPKKGNWVKPNDLECIFKIEYNPHSDRIKQVSRLNAFHGLPFYLQITITELFVNSLYDELEERGIDAKIVVQGKASRWNKQAWTFKTDSFVIYAKTNGLMLKLTGLDTIEEAAWQRVEDKIVKSSKRVVDEESVSQ